MNPVHTPPGCSPTRFARHQFTSRISPPTALYQPLSCAPRNGFRVPFRGRLMSLFQPLPRHLRAALGTTPALPGQRMLNVRRADVQHRESNPNRAGEQPPRTVCCPRSHECLRYERTSRLRDASDETSREVRRTELRAGAVGDGVTEATVSRVVHVQQLRRS